MKKKLILIFILGLSVLLGCGMKGPVHPLEEKLPRAVSSAKLLQRGSSFQVQWRMPKHNQDDTKLSDLDFIEIRHLFSDENEFCAECPTPWPLLAEIHPQLPAPAVQINNSFFLNDQGARLGQDARYQLVARNKEGASGVPLILKQTFRQPVTAPTEVKILTHDKSLELSWQEMPVLKGATRLGYQIYRRHADQPFSPLPTNLRPLKKPTFSDFGLDNGKPYSYRVRSLFDFNGERVESLPSTEVSATPSAG